MGPEHRNGEPSPESARIARIPALVGQLYTVVAELEALFPSRPFPLDGHLVGSIGDVLAAHHYASRLSRAPPRIATRWPPMAARSRSRQLSVRVSRSGENPASAGVPAGPRRGIEEFYNGPGGLAWGGGGGRPVESNGQRTVGLKKLRALMSQVPLSSRCRVLSLNSDPAARARPRGPAVPRALSVGAAQCARRSPPHPARQGFF
jgi:hypothetical protein